MATDTDRGGTIDSNELRTLLWLTEGEEPTEERIMRELAIIDENDDGVITLTEWVNYLATTDLVVN